MILFEKFGQHQPLNRQSERYGSEGDDLSTLADREGGRAAALRPLHALIETSVLSGRIEQPEDPCQSQDTLRLAARAPPPDIGGPRLPGPYHFPARNECFQVVAAPFAG